MVEADGELAFATVEPEPAERITMKTTAAVIANPARAMSRPGIENGSMFSFRSPLVTISRRGVGPDRIRTCRVLYRVIVRFE
jgi:hypothetical protein